jgi:hypothetical protein
MTATPKYWFPAKRYGWGWGPPTVWQGWAVLVTFFALLAGGAVVLLPQSGPIAFMGYSALLCAVLMAVCWVKGERPRWRRGGDESA